MLVWFLFSKTSTWFLMFSIVFWSLFYVYFPSGLCYFLSSTDFGLYIFLFFQFIEVWCIPQFGVWCVSIYKVIFKFLFWFLLWITGWLISCCLISTYWLICFFFFFLYCFLAATSYHCGRKGTWYNFSLLKFIKTCFVACVSWIMFHVHLRRLYIILLLDGLFHINLLSWSGLICHLRPMFP